MRTLFRLCCALTAALALSIALSSTQNAAAATYTVDSTADAFDVVPGNGICADSTGACTLRAALQEANSVSGPHTINFSVTGTISLIGALPTLANNMTLVGPGSEALTVSRGTGGDYRIFTIHAVTVGISGLTLTNGKTADGPPGNRGEGGGGIINYGTLTLTDVNVVGNRTGKGGDSINFGGIGGEGGGIYNAGTLTMTGCSVNGNFTGNGGGGGNFNGDGGDGGGIHNTGTLTMTNCVVNENLTGNAGNVVGGSASGGRGGGIANVGGLLSLTNVTISNNVAGNSVSSNGFGGHGGGLYLRLGKVTLVNSTVSGNRTGNTDGANEGYGGGIENGSILNVIGSTISGNRGEHTILNRRTLTMANSTVSGNTGIGITSLDSGTSLTLTNCTITENSIYGVASFGATVGNNLIAGNDGSDVMGSYNSLGHNLIGNADGGGISGPAMGFNATGDQVGTGAAPVVPLIGPLADNGGPTLTHALLAGSPALDAGNNALAKDANNNPLLTDQRGAGRIADSKGNGMNAVVDIGAFEFHRLLEPVSDKTTYEDTPLSFYFNLGDGDHLGTNITASSNNQALVSDDNLTINGDTPLRRLTVVPADHQFGTVGITLTATYPNGVVRNSTFTLTVVPVNDAPTFTVGADETVNEDSGSQTITNWATNLGNGPNETGQSLSFLVSGNTNPGLFSTLPSVGADGTLTYTPAPNAHGSAVVTISLKDNGGTANGGRDTSGSQTFRITVLPVNDAPVGVDNTYSFFEDVSLSVSTPGVLGNDTDIDSDTLVAELVSNPANGSLTLNANGSFTYTPQANFNGADSFSYRVGDGKTHSSPATVTLTVNPFNDAPVNNVPGAQTTIENRSLSFSAANGNSLSVTDVDAGTGAVRLTLSATSGVVTLARTGGLTFNVGDGTTDSTMTFNGTLASINAALDGLSFTPATGFSGTASLQLNVNDQGNTGAGGALIDVDTVGITVLDIGAFRFSGSSYSVNEGTSSGTITVLRTGGSAGAVTVNYATRNGTATAGADYTAASGTLSFAEGETSKTFNVAIIDDAAVEGNEFLNLELSNPTGGATLGSPASAFLNILDNDSCTYSLNASSRTAPAAGETLLVNVTAQSGCAWTAISNTSFISVTNGATGNGDGAVTLVVAPNNSGVPRFGSVTIAGRTFTVTQPELIPEVGLIYFDEGGYNVDEGAGRATINVRRRGNLSGTATVEFQTTDDPAAVPCDPTIKQADGTPYPRGVAYARCDYATTIDTVTFAPGETLKEIYIPLVDDAHVEGGENVEVRLRNATGATLVAAQSSGLLIISDNDTAGGANPIFNTGFFVRQHYLDFLSREPETDEPWSGVLNRCPNVNNDPLCDRTLVSQSFFGSPEFRLKGFFVYNFYRVAFGRMPEYHEIIPDMRRVSGATAQEVYAKRAALPLNFTQRQEFKTAYDALNNQQYVDALLNRYTAQSINTADPVNPESGAKVLLTRADLVSRLSATGAQALTRAQVFRAVAESDEVATAEFNGAFVAMQYYGYLRRTPEAEGFQSWLRVINQDPNNIRAMVGGFMNSTEYRLRFGQP
jgi:CSLREA domain-containing protein